MVDNPISNLQAFVGALIIGLMLTPLIIQFAHQFKFYASRDFRRKQKEPIPLLGGVGIFVAFASVCLILQIESMYPIIIASLPLVLVGLADDVFELNHKFKFLSQILSVGLWLYLVPHETLILFEMGTPHWLSALFTVFWVVGIINAVNMLDGMDGLAAGVAIICSLFLAILIAQPNSQAIIAFSGACVAFLAFNFPPAKIYLGESGSTFVGFFIGANAATISLPNSSINLILVPLFLLAVPEVDAIMAIIRRRFANSSAFRGDHDHIHHKLKKLGFSTRQTLIFIYGAAIYSGIASYTIFYLKGDFISWSVAGLATFGLLTLLGAILYLELRQALQVSQFSRTMLHRFLKVTLDLNINKNDFHASVYDLLPYYKELQQRGVADVTSFIQAFSNFVTENHPNSQMKIIGSYSVIVIGRGHGNEKGYHKQIIKEYFSLLAKHKVQKNDGKMPWGLSFYSSQSKGGVFLEKFGLSKHAHTGVELKEVS